MYFVLWVGAGNEAKSVLMIQRIISETLYKECFYPIRHLRKKIRGSWKDLYERLIPGYIFINTEDIHALYEAVKKIPGFVEILGREKTEESGDFIPLSDSEVKWLHAITLNQTSDSSKNGPVSSEDGSISSDRIVELSQIGFDENDKIVVLSGPLKELQGKIRKINVHKRVAEVEVDFMNTSTILFLGLEIIRKVEEKE